ncbi:HD domain-containing phosphohydrolase [Pelotomaculum propionicicum]|uniref:HD domain-containing phosphohydrolase n=1 Tax=Pelotomaculum propionicicum TaxID=258475 RepID=UPI003B760835
MSTVVVNLSAALIITLGYVYLSKLDKKSEVFLWASGWAVYTFGLIMALAALAWHQSAAFVIGNQLSAFISGLLFLWGAFIFTGKERPSWWLHSSVMAAVIIVISGFLYPQFVYFKYVMFSLSVVIYIFAGVEFILFDDSEKTGRIIAGLALALWGADRCIFTFLRGDFNINPLGYTGVLSLSLTVSFALLLVYLQKEKNTLNKSSEGLRHLAENARDIIYRFRLLPTQGYEYVSPAAADITGYTPEELYADPELNTRLVHPEDRPLYKAMKQSSGLFSDAVALRWVRKDGKTIWVEQQNVPIYDEVGSIVAMEGIARDISDRKQTEKFLKKVEERLQTALHQVMDIIEFLPDPTFVIDREKKVIAWNRAIEEMTGVPKKNIIGKGDYEYAFPFYGLPKQMLIDTVLESDKNSGNSSPEWKEAPIITEIYAPCLYNGSGAYLWSAVSPLFDSGGNLVGAIESFRDITERKEMEKQLKYLGTHDPLTKLANRTYFEEEMSRLESGEHEPVTIIVCDVDGLKLVNDTLGHKAGDNLLIAAADVLRVPFRLEGVVSRVGGDEFAVVLKNTDKETADRACQQICEATKERNKGAEIPLSLSVGFATRKDPLTSLTELFKEADNNMYRVKLHSSQSARSTIVKSMMKMLETRDHITEGHGERVQDLVVELARAYGLPENRMNDLRLLSQFHDIGKVGIPDKILFKPGSLNTDDEFAEMQRHCSIGYRIAQSVPDLVPIADWILKHHEWWNGKGYPLGLEGEAIPVECRILSIVDAYDAMTNDRPYRKELTHTQAITELLKCSGTQFDPQLVSVFLRLWQPSSYIRVVK